MKKVSIILIGLLVIFIETFFTNYIGAGFSVDFLLIFTVLISLYLDKNESLITVGILGLISDLISGGMVGITALLFLAISYFINNVKKSLFKDSRLIVCIIVYTVSAIFSIINAVISSFFFSPNPIIIVLLKSIFLIPALNTFFALLLYVLFQDKLIKLREE